MNSNGIRRQAQILKSAYFIHTFNGIAVWLHYTEDYEFGIEQALQISLGKPEHTLA